MALALRTLARGLLLWLIAVACLQAGGAARADGNDRRMVLRGAWLADDDGLLGGVERAGPSGGRFELHLIEAVGRRTGLAFSLQHMDPADVAAAFAAGTLDFVLPVQRHERLAQVGRPSRSFGVRADVMLCRHGLPPLTLDGTAALGEAADRGWRLGVSAGRSYGPGPDAILASAHGRGLVRRVRADVDLVQSLVAKEVQCILAPRLELMAALSRRLPGETFIGHQRFVLGEAEPGILFNTATVDAATIDAVDRALQALQEDGTSAELRRSAARPTLLNFAVATAWFAWFDIVGTIAFALSGVLIARAEGYALLGAFVLSALPAVGGGVVRDLIVGREPIGIVASPLPLSLVLATVLAAYVAYATYDRLGGSRHPVVDGGPGDSRWRRMLSFGNLLELTDAIGLAAFTVLGVVVAVRVGAEPLWLWGPLCAALSGAGGGILRDILRVGYNNPALRTSFYAEVCVCWGLLLALAVLYLLSEEDALLLRLSIAVTVLGAFATRLLVVGFGIRSPRF